jgi:hypothetical protein
MTNLRTITLGLITGFCVGLHGQDAVPSQTPLDPATYESFFRAVSALTTAPPVSGPATLNGQATNLVLVQPRLEEALGITVDEAQQLRTVAADCATKIDAIDEAVKPLVKELRFEALAEEAPSEPITRSYNELNRQRAQMVLDHIEELKAAFGEARFSQIEAVLKTRRSGESLFGRRVPLVVRPSDK